MTQARPLFRSFSGGEIAPEMTGRIDLDKFQTGLSLCRNFITMPHGPAMSRGGLRYIQEARDSGLRVCVRPFSFAPDQTYVVELGHHYIRIHSMGASLTESPKAIESINQANPGILGLTAHGFANGDWLFADSIGGMTALNGRFYRVANALADSFTLLALDGTPIDTTALPAYTSGGTVARLLSLATTYDGADVFDIKFTQSADVLTLTHPKYPPRELRRLGATSWELVDIEFKPALEPPTGVSASATTGSGSIKYEYVVTAVDASGAEESFASLPPMVATFNITGITQANPGEVTTDLAHGLVAGDRCYVKDIDGMVEITDGVYIVNTAPTTTTLTLKRLDGTLVDTTDYPVWISTGTISRIHITNALGTSPNKNTINWTAKEGAKRYNVYKLRNGLYGYIGQTSGTSFDDDNITADVLRTPPDPTNASPFEQADDYPDAVGYFNQRRIFAGTNNRPQNGWMTKPGTESNLTSALPTQDDDAIAFRVTSGQQNRVRHIVPLSDLLMLTDGAELRLFTENSDALTPSTFNIKPQSFIGSTNVRPIMTANAVLFVQGRGSHLREMSYSWEQNAYAAADISIMAPHLFGTGEVDGDEEHAYQIVDMAYTLAPIPVAWLVRDDGVLLGVTYVPEHRVVGWHQHVTDGAFESVTAVQEGNEDALYAVVRREIDGRTVRYIERLERRDQVRAIANAFCLDSGLTYRGSPETVIRNLWHLEGRTVGILADGKVQPDKVVQNGQITLDEEASVVHVGLRYDCDLETLPLAVEGAAAAGMGVLKSIAKAHIRVLHSNAVRVGPSFDKLVDGIKRASEPFGEPPALRSGVVPVPLSGKWSEDGKVCIRQSDPVPLTIVSMALDVEIV